MVKVISCSEGDTKSALGDFPKVFILALAIFDITYTPSLGVLPVRALRVPWPESIFLFQLDLHDVANNIKHYANIDHETPCSELSM